MAGAAAPFVAVSFPTDGSRELTLEESFDQACELVLDPGVDELGDLTAALLDSFGHARRSRHGYEGRECARGLPRCDKRQDSRLSDEFRQGRPCALARELQTVSSVSLDFGAVVSGEKLAFLRFGCLCRCSGGFLGVRWVGWGHGVGVAVEGVPVGAAVLWPPRGARRRALASR